MILHATWNALLLDKALDQSFPNTDFHLFAQRLSTALDSFTILDLLHHSDFKCFAYFSAHSMTIELCHHYSVIRSNNWRTTDSFHVALTGMTANDDALLFNPNDIHRTSELLLPLPSALGTVVSIADLLAFPTAIPHTVKKLMPSLIQVPPHLFATLQLADSRDPSDLFFLIRTALTDYIDTCIANLEPSDTQSHDTLRLTLQTDSMYFLQFLYVAAVQPDTIAINVDPNAPRALPSIMAWRQVLHRANIATAQPNQTAPVTTPPTTPAPNAPVFASPDTFAEATTALAFAVNTFATAADKLTETKAPSASQPTRAWYKQPSFLQEQVLRLMARHDADIVSRPTTTLSTFLSLSANSSAAQQYLLDYLQSTLHCQDIRVDTFVVLCITQLQFVYSPIEGPSRLSLFKIFDQANQMTASSDADIVAQATIDAGGDGMTFEQISKRLRNTKLLTIPKSTNDFETTIRNMSSIILFIFGECYLYDQLSTWQIHIEHHRTSYRHCAELDPLFFSHQMAIIDHSIQAFFRSARTAKDVGDLAFRLLNFDQQQHAIAICNAMVTRLHPLVHAVTQSTKRPLDNPTVDGTPDRSAHGRAAINPSPDTAFKLRNGYAYATLLPASIVRTAPKLNGTSVCCRWHIKGICVQNCERKATHIALPPDVRAKLTAFLARAYTTAGPPTTAPQAPAQLDDHPAHT